jgi:hypothetical protein
VKTIVGVLLLVAALEVAGASAWEAAVEADETCQTDDALICVESFVWLEK